MNQYMSLAERKEQAARNRRNTMRTIGRWAFPALGATVLAMGGMFLAGSAARPGELASAQEQVARMAAEAEELREQGTAERLALVESVTGADPEALRSAVDSLVRETGAERALFWGEDEKGSLLAALADGEEVLVVEEGPEGPMTKTAAEGMASLAVPNDEGTADEEDD